MATNAANWQAICDALVDGTATVTQQTKLADAVITLIPDQTILDKVGVARASLTQGQKLVLALWWYRNEAKRTLAVAAQMNATAAAQAAIDQAVTDAGTVIP